MMDLTIVPTVGSLQRVVRFNGEGRDLGAMTAKILAPKRSTGPTDGGGMVAGAEIIT